MQKTNEKNHEYRFSDNGPKYLIRGPGCDMGVVILQPQGSHSLTIAIIPLVRFFIP